MTVWTLVPLLFALIYLWDSLVAMSRAARTAARAALGTSAIEADGCLPTEQTVPN
jgi:hypothetical protein